MRYACPHSTPDEDRLVDLNRSRVLRPVNVKHQEPTLRVAIAVALMASVVGCGGDDETTFTRFPEILSFSAEPGAVVTGSSTTLRWEVTDADTVSIGGLFEGGLDLVGSQATGPLAATQTFTLVARSEVGESKRSVTVTVQDGGEVKIVRFEADPAIIASGSTELVWSTENALQVDIWDEAGNSVAQATDLNGRVTVAPTTSTSYLLTAGGPGGPVSATATVLVGNRPTIESFEAVPPQIASGSPSVLSWRVSGAESIILRDEGGQEIARDLPNEGSREVRPGQTTSYTLVAASAEISDARMATVEVVSSELPRVTSFSLTPSRLAEAGDVELSWATENADMVQLRADGVRVDDFSGERSGRQTLRVDRTATYELRAENGAGASTETQIVEVGAADLDPPEIRHAPPASVPAGMGIALQANVTDAASGVAGVTLFYRASGGSSFQTASMSPDGASRFRGVIPASAVTPPSVEYYLLATDTSPRSNASVDPSGAPANLHSVTVNPADTSAPTITHTVVGSDQPEGMSVQVTATVTDDNAVGTVTLYYRASSGTSYTAATMTAAGSSYSTTIPGSAVVAPGVDYYLVADDTAAPPNVATEPATAPATPHGFTVRAADVSPPMVTHTPVADGQPAGGAVTVTAEVTDPSGVGTVRLHYRSNGGSWTQTAMSGAGTTLSASIPAAAVTTPGVSYYIEAEDMASPVNRGTSPSGAPGVSYQFTVTPGDMAPPSITHVELYDGQAPATVLDASFDISDTSGVASARLYYRTRGQSSFASVAMTQGSGTAWTARIPASALGAQTTVEYYAEATDASSSSNRGTLPSAAPSTVLDFVVGASEGEPNDTRATATRIPSGSSAVMVGSLEPASDEDWYRLDIPSGTPQSVRLETTSGGAGRCTGVDTLLRLFASDGTTMLAANDYGGVGSCSLIDPAVLAGARALAPGTYYVQVYEDGRNQTVSRYELSVTLQPAVCGNGLLESGAAEQCDDGNTASGDGCSSTCRYEPLYTFTGSSGSRTGNLSAGAEHIYAVTVAAGGNLTAEVSNGSGGCPGDAFLDVLRPDGVTLVGSDDDDGPGVCPRVDPIRDSFVQTLAAGTWYLRVRGRTASTVVGAYTLDVSVTSYVCGNTTVETGEQCDDGNVVDHDGCSASCQWETRGTAMGTGASFTDGITPTGNIDWFRVVVPSGSSVSARTYAPTAPGCSALADTVIKFWASDRTTELTSDDDGGDGFCSFLDPSGNAAVRNLAGGDYYVSVEEYGNNTTIAMYQLDIQILAPRCGDGTLGGSEVCDDGNTTSGDGCSSSCQLEGNAESEPNDAESTADLLIASGARSGTVRGTLTAADEDWYRIEVPAGYHVFAEVIDDDGSCPVATELRLREAGNIFSRAFDDNDGPGACPRLSPGLNASTSAGVRSLPARTYYLEVQEDSPASGSPRPYQLRVQLLAPGCGDLYLDSGEQCDDGNTTNGDGCSSTCQITTSESEPNDNLTQAMVLTSTLGAGMVGGSTSTQYDNDRYVIDVTAGQSLEAAVHIGAIDQCVGGFDSEVEILDPSGSRVSFNDRGERYGTGSCSLIEPISASNLAAGRYQIRVAPNSSGTFNYVLSWRLY